MSPFFYSLLKIKSQYISQSKRIVFVKHE